jgi:hypothetical protein
MATRPPDPEAEQPPVVAAADPQPKAMGPLREVLIAAGVLAFFVLWGILLVNIWTTEAGRPADLDDVLVGAAAGLAGAVGAGFALAMGLEKKKPPDDSLLIAGTGLPKLNAEETRSWILTVGIYGYAVVSALALVTWLANGDETPDEIRALAVAFAGYVLSLVTSAFSAVRKAD